MAVARGLLAPEDLRPTLIIGLGGTGKMILTRIRAQFEQYFGDVPRNRVRLMELDIDPAEETARVDEKVVRLREDEKIDLGEVRAREIVQQIRAGHLLPLHGWMHRHIRLAEMTLRRGGQQIRQLGRLAFLWHAEQIPESQNLRDRLTKVLDALTSLYAVRADQPLALQVFVISSLCGGTGSGMFIDAAYLLQDILRGRGLLDKTTIVAFLTTPLFFSSAPQQNLRPNTWAALQELDYFTRVEAQERRSGSTFFYFNDRQIPTYERPFHIIYLVDAIDHLGRNIAHEEYMARLVSQVAFTLSASRIGDEAASLINNVRAVRDTERGTVYSTLGFASYVVPIDEIVGVAAAHLLRDALPETVRLPKGEEERQAMEQEISRMLEADRSALFLGLEPLLARLNPRLAQELRTKARVERGYLRAIDSRGLLDEVPRRLNRAREDLDQQLQEHLRTASGEVSVTFVENFEQRLRTLLVERGLSFAQRFAEHARQSLQEAWITAGRELENAQVRASSLEQGVEAARGDLRDAAMRGGGLFRRGRPLQAAERYVLQYGQWVEALHTVRIYEETRALLANMLEQVERHLRTFNRFREAIDHILSDRVPQYLAEMREAIEGLDPVRAEPLLKTEKEFEERYRPYWNLAMNDFRNLARGRIQDWLGSRDDADLFSKLIQTAREAWGPHLYGAREFYVEEVIRTKGEDPARLLKGLQSKAAYFWQTLTAEAVARGEGREKTVVIGVADAQETIFADYLQEFAAQTGNSVISTGDPYRITVLQLVHGITFETLTQRDLYLQDYKKAMRDFQPIHIFPDFYLGDELDKARDKRSILAKALAYGLIRNRLDEFTLVEEGTAKGEGGRKGAPETLTNRGLFDLMWRVAHNQELYERLNDLVRTWESSHEKAEILERLQNFRLKLSPEAERRERWLREVIEEEVEEHRKRVEIYY